MAWIVHRFWNLGCTLIITYHSFFIKTYKTKILLQANAVPMQTISLLDVIILAKQKTFSKTNCSKYQCELPPNWLSSKTFTYIRFTCSSKMEEKSKLPFHPFRLIKLTKIQADWKRNKTILSDNRVY